MCFLIWVSLQTAFSNPSPLTAVWHFQNCHPAPVTESLSFTQCTYYFNEKIEVIVRKLLCESLQFLLYKHSYFPPISKQDQFFLLFRQSLCLILSFSPGWDLLPSIISVCLLSSTLSSLLPLSLLPTRLCKLLSKNQTKTYWPLPSSLLCVQSLSFRMHSTLKQQFPIIFLCLWESLSPQHWAIWFLTPFNRACSL